MKMAHEYEIVEEILVHQSVVEAHKEVYKKNETTTTKKKRTRGKNWNEKKNTVESYVVDCKNSSRALACQSEFA